MELEIYDTTLRDGSQQEGISLTVGDKLRIASLLDDLGVHYIEGGWPGANPKDDEFFSRAGNELKLANATLVAFGSTRRAGVAVASLWLSVGSPEVPASRACTSLGTGSIWSLVSAIGVSIAAMPTCAPTRRPAVSSAIR